VDGAALVAVDRAALVDRAAEDVHHAPQGRRPHRHRDRRSRAHDAHPAPKAVGRAHRDGAHHAVAQLLLDLEREVLLREGLALVDQLQRLVDVGHALAGELDVDHRADALDDLAFVHLGRAHGFVS
jgi:hypothetical protein